MTIINITPCENGAHQNSSSDKLNPISILPGWALLPESVGTPDTLENFPFGNIEVDYSEAIPIVTAWEATANTQESDTSDFSDPMKKLECTAAEVINQI